MVERAGRPGAWARAGEHAAPGEQHAAGRARDLRLEHALQAGDPDHGARRVAERVEGGPRRAGRRAQLADDVAVALGSRERARRPLASDDAVAGEDRRARRGSVVRRRQALVARAAPGRSAPGPSRTRAESPSPLNGSTTGARQPPHTRVVTVTGSETPIRSCRRPCRASTS